MLSVKAVKKNFSSVLFILACLTILTIPGGCRGVSGQDSGIYAPPEQNRLVVYTSQPEAVYEPLIQEFEERTGIWVQVETGGTGELLRRIASEGDDTPCDLMFGGGADSLEAFGYLFSPYESSVLSAVQEDFLSPDGTWTPFSTLPVVLIYNSKLLRNNPPSHWQDLLDGAWQGRIAFADPENSGYAYTALTTLVTALTQDGNRSADSILSAFVRNLDSHIFPQYDDVIEQVSNGNFYIAIVPEDDALRGVQKGYDIAIVYPDEGTTAIPDGMAIVAGCDHEENARKFIDFALGKNAQNYLTEECARRSVRTDVPADGSLFPALRLLPWDSSQAARQYRELLEQWKSIMEVTP